MDNETFNMLLMKKSFEPSMPDLVDYETNKKEYYSFSCLIEDFEEIFLSDNFIWFTLCRGRSRNSEHVQALVKRIITDNEEMNNLTNSQNMLHTITDMDYLVNVIKCMSRENGKYDPFNNIHRLHQYERKVFNKNWLHEAYNPDLDSEIKKEILNEFNKQSLKIEINDILNKNDFHPTMPLLNEFKNNSEEYFHLTCTFEEFRKVFPSNYFIWYTLCISRSFDSESEFIEGIVKRNKNVKYDECYDSISYVKIINVIHLVNKIKNIASVQKRNHNVTNQFIADHYNRKVYDKLWLHDQTNYDEGLHEKIFHLIMQLFEENQPME